MQLRRKPQMTCGKGACFAKVSDYAMASVSSYAVSRPLQLSSHIPQCIRRQRLCVPAAARDDSGQQIFAPSVAIRTVLLV